MSATKAVLHNHLASFGRRDLDGILADYAPTAVLFTPAGPLVGVEAIKPLFESLLAEFSKPGATFDLRHESIHGDHAYILWSAETAENRYEFATDTFVVEDGRIVAQSFAATIVPKAGRPA